ncbi:DUF4332 domain-containing protein [Leptolyngbya sp. PCC 6406]|uniref:DUF4332 domain-containing protein n=1 Tax=Leptolyngbya sp. PCC 6406 TaxID=1173264 RepID=UPI0002AC3580|nr:DUF4332 domain-containing protein [Leptolyngbya sp. PCC 6406]
MNIKIWPLASLPGLSAEHQRQLQSAGLHTTADLLQQARSPQTTQTLATTLGLPLRYPRKWAALANLARLPSVGCQHCGLLLHSGVQSIEQLAVSTPGRLHSQIKRLHTAQLQRSDLCPPPAQVVQWVQEAQQFLRSASPHPHPHR